MRKLKLLAVLGLTIISLMSLVRCASTEEEPAEILLSDLMRERVDELRSVKNAILSEETPIIRGFISFENSVPTRENLLTEEQWEELHAFDSMYNVLIKQANASSYNSIVQTCISCHERTCPGPLRLLQGLIITEEELQSLTKQ